jgi:hypothetical protein
MVIAATLSFACTIVRVDARVANSFSLTAMRDGRPLANSDLRIRATGKPGKRSFLDMKVRLDGGGRAHVADLATGTYELIAIENGRQDTLAEFEVVPSGVADLQINLPAKPVPPMPVILKNVRGQVVDPTGAVIPKAKITFSRIGRPKEAVATSTDGNGEFDIPAENGHYEAMVQVPGFNTAIVPVEVSRESAAAMPAFKLSMALAECTPFPNPYTYRVTEWEPN